MTAPTAPVTVLSAGAVEFVIRELGRRFEGATGTPVAFTFGTIAGVKKRLAAGETADIVIGTLPAIRELDEAGTLIAGTAIEIGSTATGICVREGAPVPDISTPERLRDLLRGARSFAYTDPASGGTSGIFLERLLERLGILDEVRAKKVVCINGEDVVRKVGSGQAELGSTFVSEFHLAGGITSAGALPSAFGNATTYAAALLAAPGGGGRDIAHRFLATIRTADSRPLWLAGGFQPAG